MVQGKADVIAAELDGKVKGEIKYNCDDDSENL